MDAMKHSESKVAEGTTLNMISDVFQASTVLDTLCMCRSTVRLLERGQQGQQPLFVAQGTHVNVE